MKWAINPISFLCAKLTSSSKQVVHPIAPGEPFTQLLLGTVPGVLEFSIHAWRLLEEFFLPHFNCLHTGRKFRPSVFSCFFFLSLSIHRFFKESPGKPCSTKILYSSRVLKMICSCSTLRSSNNREQEIKQLWRSAFLFSLVYKQRHCAVQ